MSVGNNTLGAVIHQFNHFSFGTIDYVVFVLMLSASLIIGIYFGFFGHGADNTDEYLLGGRRMKIIPIAFSLVASSGNLLTFAYILTLFLMMPVFTFIPSLAFAQEWNQSCCMNVVQGAIMIGSVALFCLLGAQKVPTPKIVLFALHKMS
ncbi:sodium-coupled monocarboxylate transporter 1-like [Bactrocera neohumeralis]|uniref:sodium-coupled monocarboxylate transporter 1-like n=1 Tax=Bactrocera neohumeralis TaxID=98809 RepID=UPI0021667CE2|nr:sodium-coupled monocarboxylate transporter 1-like [Bactrocera neohumeralis]